MIVFEPFFSLLALMGKAFSKIFIALIGTLVFFLMVPQSRTARIFVAAMLCAVVVGFLMHLFGLAKEWDDAVAHSMSFVGGFFSFTLLTVFTRFHMLASNDRVLLDGIYHKVRGWLLKLCGVKDKGGK